eukprot:6497814-Alexandrium_andersonii.AAC.1
MPASLRTTLLSEKPRRGLIARFTHVVGLDDVVANKELLKATFMWSPGRVPGKYELADAVMDIDARQASTM